ncbi:Lon protease family protein [Tepidibacter formicigenes]|jgi:lon-related putative ATP-dependent protease|uniref:endopeptidase La n=1 Tax=Tepidibacter formicigenes DSM 15518 TaxID=1123349 RepID=A0A1M6N451_9FIRM|nr:ATP-binding protein [Tepidibacter formicigenes]SHJ90460.1 lon-related putative ATP-dependent protease [Tepidibacter formicigenes DSM 15518]
MKYKTTADIKPLKGILGQEKATWAMEFGLKIDDPGYNIYISGETGTGRTSYALNILKKYAKDRAKNKDWCYVYNFENPREPIALSFEKGKGKIFKKDIEKFIENLYDELPRAFDSEEYEKEKNKILDEYEIKKELLIKKMKEHGEKKGFKFKSNKFGMIFVPKDENVDTTSEEFLKVKRELENLTMQVVSKIKELENIAKEDLLNLEEEVGTIVINPQVDNLIKKYGEDYKVKKYLFHLRDDILEKMYLFYLDEEELKNIDEKQYLIKYQVNLFIDSVGNGNMDSAPVVLEINPNYINLFGKVEYESVNGIIRTDFTKIVPGALHKANGGYLVVYIDQVLRSPYSWDMLKRCLQVKEVKIDTLTGIKPEPIPIDVKVILIGSQYLYNILYRYDEEFNKYFKVIVDFDSEMNRNEDNEIGVARFISSYCNENNLKHFTYDAVNVVLKYSSRLVENTKKLSTRFNKIAEIIIESNLFANIRGSEFVEPNDVKKAIYEKWNRVNKIEKKIDEMYKTGQLLISVEGEKIGVINGLSVINMGEYSFGRPVVITATTSPGNKGIINIEREAKLSGRIHDKGILILSGYLLENFSKERPVSITANICFEQSYSGVDGDSASGAELYALLSSLSQIPIKQNIAVTGSINQKGEVQVVGGVTQKIEGFYHICKAKGLNGKQGVILPKNNLNNLVLLDEVQKAIDEGKFHIYPVTRIEEAIEILTGKPFAYIYDKIINRLNKFYEISK